MRIYTEADAAPWVGKIKIWLRQNGFAGLDNVRVVMRDMSYAGLAQCGSDIVYIKPGMGVMYFLETCVHELAHHWLYKNRHQSGGFAGEGAAEWVAYKFLQQIGTDESLRHARYLLTTHPQARGVDYSEALAHMLKRERAG